MFFEKDEKNVVLNVTKRRVCATYINRRGRLFEV
jgi:hypothetical protein